MRVGGQIRGPQALDTVDFAYGTDVFAIALRNQIRQATDFDKLLLFQ